MIYSVEDALTRPLRLPIGEADAALVAELLVGKNRGDRFQVPLSAGVVPSQPLRLAVARTLSTGVLRFLLGAGGARPRTVLRNGRRVHGRLWDGPLNSGMSATFSEMPFDFLIKLCTVVLPLSERRQETLQRSALADLSRDERKSLNRAAPQQALTAFDHVFCALAVENRGALRLQEAVDAPLRQWLVQASPLAALFCADEARNPASDAGEGRDAIDVDALCAPDLIRLLELCDDALAGALVRRLKSVWTRSADGDDFSRRCHAFARNIQTLLRALDEARRLDLIGPVVRLVAALPGELPADARARLVRLPGVVTMADRDRVVASLAAIVDVGAGLDVLRGRLVNERYGDDRYEESQLALRVIDEHYLPRRDALAAFSRALTGAVG